MPLAISDSELQIIMNAARPLGRGSRPILSTVAAELERLRDGLGPAGLSMVRAAQREFWDAPDFSGGSGVSKYE